MRDYAFKKIDEGFDLIIMGHRHKPQMISHGKGFYVNLGDWIEYFTYGVFRNNEFELKKFFSPQSLQGSKSQWL